MKTLFSNAVYIGDDVVGFRCQQCNKVVNSMFGNTCNSCRNINEAIREKNRLLKEIAENIEKATSKDGL